jgi:cytochrome bd ubiquinol oxidase subunit II
MTNLIAVVLFVGVEFYAIFGGADFGAGFWDLTAGGAERGRGPRDLIDHSLGPVWEANHVWLIYCLVILWSAFPGAFAAIMTTLYIPLGLAVLGIVLRGSGFAFRKVAVHTSEQRVAGATFAASSVITPFFLGAIAGGIASGRVPTGGGGDPVTSWLNPTSALGGVLAVAVCAYLAAVFLTAEARIRDDSRLEDYFGRRALLAAGATGILTLGGIAILDHGDTRLFHHLIGVGLPLVVISAVSGAAALVLLGRVAPRVVRVLAIIAVAAVVGGWGVAQYPFILGDHLRISEAAAPTPTLIALTVVFGIAVLLVVPSIALLYRLQQRGALEERPS